MDEQYLIWSNYHRMWWRPNAAGYTAQFEKAGRWSRDEAILRCRIRDQDPDNPLPEIPIRESDVLAVITPPLTMRARVENMLAASTQET